MSASEKCDHLGDPGVDGRISKWIFEMAWIGFSLLRIGTDGGIL
jgi:hypothetical protein